MKGIVVVLIFGFIQFTICGPLSPQKPDSTTSKANIIKQINKLNDDGSYTYGYESNDGSFKVETRSKDGTVKGKYGFIDPSGQFKTIDYTAGARTPPLPELGASATETEALTVKANARENAADKSSSSAENSSGTSSGESSGEDNPAFNAFNNQKDGGETSELTKRQGQLSGPGNNGVSLGSPYPGQQQYPASQPYNPSTQLQGGQFADPRGRAGYGGGAVGQPQYFQGQGGQPYYGGAPQQFAVGGFQRGVSPQTHYAGRQFPGQYVSTSPQSVEVQTSPGQFGTQGQFQDEEGFISGVPGNFYSTGGPQQQQFVYGGQQSPQGLPYVRPGYQPGPYPGVGTQSQQLSRPTFGRLPASGVASPQNFRNANTQQEYVPNPQIDGFSEDSDQDGFVDAYPGSDGSKEAADDKSTRVNSSNDLPGQYAPQILGPQVMQRQPRPSIGVSPYTEQELQQLYAQQGLGRPQAAYQPQLNRYPFPGPPQYQSYPVQGQYLRQIQFSAPQIRGGGLPAQYSSGLPYQGGPGFPGQTPYIQGQPQRYSQAGRDPRILNSLGAGTPAGLPYDYIGGVGPNGFPIGGPQQPQFLQQQQQLGQGQEPSSGPLLTPTPGPNPVATTDPKKDN